MVIIILYNSKNTSMRCCTKSYFDVTYCFGCKTCNSPPFLLKIGANEAYLQGVLVAFLNWLQPVFIGPVRSGFSSVFFFKRPNCNQSSSVFLVWFGPILTFFQFIEPDRQTLIMPKLISTTMELKKEELKNNLDKPSQTMDPTVITFYLFLLTYCFTYIHNMITKLFTYVDIFIVVFFFFFFFL